MNASEKRNENALNMKHDYAFFLKQFESMVPILDVLMNVFDWKLFSEPPGRCLNSYYPLNPPAKVFSVLNLFAKISSLMNGF